MIALNNRHASEPKMEMDSCLIEVTQQEELLHFNTDIMATPAQKGKVFTFTLNPGFEVKSITMDGTALNYKREKHLLWIEFPQEIAEDRHFENITQVYKLPAVVAINRFPTDTDNEIDFIIAKCKELGVNTVLSTVWAEGGKGGEELAKEVVRLCEEEQGDFTFSYDLDMSIEEKIKAIVTKVYGGDGINILPAAKKQIEQLTALGFGNLPICVAKTQYSFSDDPTKLGAPEGFTVTVKNVKVSAGAGFIVVLTGDILTMPGLPKVPAAEKIDVDENGKITGLF